MTDRARDAAARWYGRMQAQDAAQHRAAFEAWRAADPENAREYALLDTIVDLAGATAHRPSPRARGLVQRRPALRWAAALAAGAAVVIAIVVTPGGRSGDGTPMVIAQATAAPATFRLADGSSVTLDMGGRAQVVIDSTARHVRLERGRAQFRVNADPSRPFTVDAGRQRVVARATRFDIMITGRGARLALLEGSVDVTIVRPNGDPQPAQTLHPGDRAETIENRIVVMRSGTRADSDGRQHFDDRALSEVVALANARGLGPSLEIGDRGLDAARVTGSFDVRDRASLARKLAAVFDLRLVARDGTIALHKK